MVRLLDLEDKLLIRIFKYLDYEDRVSVALASKKVKAVFDRNSNRIGLRYINNIVLLTDHLCQLMYLTPEQDYENDLPRPRGPHIVPDEELQDRLRTDQPVIIQPELKKQLGQLMKGAEVGVIRLEECKPDLAFFKDLNEFLLDYVVHALIFADTDFSVTGVLGLKQLFNTTKKLTIHSRVFSGEHISTATERLNKEFYELAVANNVRKLVLLPINCVPPADPEILMAIGRIREFNIRLTPFTEFELGILAETILNNDFTENVTSYVAYDEQVKVRTLKGHELNITPKQIIFLCGNRKDYIPENEEDYIWFTRPLQAGREKHLRVFLFKNHCALITEVVDRLVGGIQKFSFSTITYNF